LQHHQHHHPSAEATEHVSIIVSSSSTKREGGMGGMGGEGDGVMVDARVEEQQKILVLVITYFDRLDCFVFHDTWSVKEGCFACDKGFGSRDRESRFSKGKLPHRLKE
jgi:hypothetical protein